MIGGASPATDSIEQPAVRQYRAAVDRHHAAVAAVAAADAGAIVTVFRRNRAAVDRHRAAGFVFIAADAGAIQAAKRRQRTRITGLPVDRERVSGCDIDAGLVHCARHDERRAILENEVDVVADDGDTADGVNDLSLDDMPAVRKFGDVRRQHLAELFLLGATRSDERDARHAGLRLVDPLRVERLVAYRPGGNRPRGRIGAVALHAPSTEYEAGRRGGFREIHDAGFDSVGGWRKRQRARSIIVGNRIVDRRQLRINRLRTRRRCGNLRHGGLGQRGSRVPATERVARRLGLYRSRCRQVRRRALRVRRRDKAQNRRLAIAADIGDRRHAGNNRGTFDDEIPLSTKRNHARGGFQHGCRLCARTGLDGHACTDRKRTLRSAGSTATNASRQETTVCRHCTTVDLNSAAGAVHAAANAGALVFARRRHCTAIDRHHAAGTARAAADACARVCRRRHCTAVDRHRAARVGITAADGGARPGIRRRHRAAIDRHRAASTPTADGGE